MHTTHNATIGLLLIAHGSRRADANADLEHVAQELRARGYPIVVPSFLELAEPNIEGGARRCIEQGAQVVVLLPYFLSSGVHVLRDLTEAQQRLSADYPRVEFHLAEPLGRHPLLIQVVVDRAEEALHPKREKHKEETVQVTFPKSPRF